MVHNPSRIFLLQQKYVANLLHKLHLYTCKFVRTPFVGRITTSLSDGELLADPAKYMHMVSALQYFTITEHDIEYAVHIVFQFMHVFHTTHLHIVKCMFRHL